MKLKTILLNLICSVAFAGTATPPLKLHVCTVASFQNRNLDILRISAQHYDHDLEILGMDRPYRNNFYKLYRMQEHLKTTPEKDIVLFVDAFDVLILGREEELLKRFFKLNSPCVFSAERRLYPKDPLAGLKIKYPKANSSFRYLNSGCYIGQASFLSLMINEIIANRYTIPLKRYRRLQSDQMHCHRFFAENQSFIKLDTKNEIFLNLSDVKDEELIIDDKTKMITVKESGNSPLIVHGNGPGELLYEKLAKRFF